MGSTKVVFERVESVVQNGDETTEHSSLKVLRFDREPDYVKLYINDISKIFSLPDSVQPLIIQLAKSMTYDGFVYMTKSSRERIGKTLGINEKTIRNRLTVLCNSGILKRVGNAEYEMNPNLFAKGDWPTIYKRRQEFELCIRYKENGERILKTNTLPIN